MKMSKELKKLVNALLYVQEELQNPKKTEENPYFKSRYAPLDQILKEVREVLSRHGIVLLQDTGADEEGNVSITTILIHISGEWLTSSPLTVQPRGKNGKPTPQDVGSAITYARRYQLMSLLGIAGEEEDDDGARASQRTQRTAQPPRGPTPRKSTQGRAGRPTQGQDALRVLDPERYRDKTIKALIMMTKTNKGEATLRNVLDQLEEYHEEGSVTEEEYTRIRETLRVGV